MLLIIYKAISTLFTKFLLNKMCYDVLGRCGVGGRGNLLEEIYFNYGVPGGT